MTAVSTAAATAVATAVSTAVATALSTAVLTVYDYDSRLRLAFPPATMVRLLFSLTVTQELRVLVGLKRAELLGNFITGVCRLRCSLAFLSHVIANIKNLDFMISRSFKICNNKLCFGIPHPFEHVSY